VYTAQSEAMVMIMFKGEENRFSRIHLTAPVSDTGGGDSGINSFRTKEAVLWVILTLFQFDAIIINIHHRRNTQADDQIKKHQ
jgi:hypothetical protein